MRSNGEILACGLRPAGSKIALVGQRTCNNGQPASDELLFAYETKGGVRRLTRLVYPYRAFVEIPLGMLPPTIPYTTPVKFAPILPFASLSGDPFSSEASLDKYCWQLPFTLLSIVCYPPPSLGLCSPSLISVGAFGVDQQMSEASGYNLY